MVYVFVGMTVYHTKEDRGAGVVLEIVRNIIGGNGHKGTRIRIKWEGGDETLSTLHELKKYKDNKMKKEAVFAQNRSYKKRTMK